MEELSKQLSAQLNETINITGTITGNITGTITSTEFHCSAVDDKNKIKIINSDRSQKLESTNEIKDKEREKKMTIELSKYLKEDVIVKEINNAHFIILGEGINTEYRIKININYFNIGNIPDINILLNISDIPNIFPNITNINIREIYTKVKNYINLKPEKKCYIETHYTKTNTQFLIKKITLKYDDCEFYGKNYIECDSKILEYVKMNKLKLKESESIKIKEEQEKVVTKLKLKYGDKTDWIITYKNIRNQNLQLDLVISDVDIEYIDLLDIIPNYQANIIMNGYIKNTNYVDYKDIKNKSVHKCDILIPKNILNITIKNCPNLKIINNIIHLENNCYLKIINCPKLEFIENYNNFSEIYKDNSLIKVFNDEIKSLLKDQQEYALIIQSLLKKINKLENKALGNE